MTRTRSTSASDHVTGKLRIGDQWNAITIIALSQNNPLKAVAEFVENSIDAGARRITITRGKEKGLHFLRIKDDGAGIRRDEHGIPDFQYVATHICDSIKRQLKQDGAMGLQGEFGIGLLSFWTVGEELVLSSAGADGRTYQMRMRKGDPRYQVDPKRTMFPEPGTELMIKPILSGVKQLSGEKIQWYLASELRDRIRHSGVEIKVLDRTARAEFKVEPRQFEGRLLHELNQPAIAPKELYLEIYLNAHDPGNAIGLYRNGTRVMEDLSVLPMFQTAPWTSRYLQGIVDAGYLNLTPGTRTGIIHDEALNRLAGELAPVAQALNRIIEDQQRAEEETASKQVLRSIQKALKEALLALPAEEYDWFDIHRGEGKRPPKPGEPIPTEVAPSSTEGGSTSPWEEEAAPKEPQKQFFEFAGPLFSVRISPASCVIPVETDRNFRAIPRDRTRHLVERDLSFQWEVTEGEGRMENTAGEIATFLAPKEPGLTRIKVTACQESVQCEAEALVTVVQSLLPDTRTNAKTLPGIPSYTFKKAPGELWRSAYDPEQNLVVINNGHRDFVFASRNKALQLRYICRLFSKELVLINFMGANPNDLLERLIELSIHTEEFL